MPSSEINQLPRRQKLLGSIYMRELQVVTDVTNRKQYDGCGALGRAEEDHCVVGEQA